MRWRALADLPRRWRTPAGRFNALVTVLALLTLLAVAPTPTASPTPVPVWSIHGTGSNTFVDQSTLGPGATPPEGPAFANGQPNAPMSPYDWFSTNPTTPGVSGLAQYEFNAGFHAATFHANAAFLVSGIGGSITDGIYWGEPLLGPLDPHEGRSPIPYRIVFPTHAGSDDVAALQAVIPYNVSVADNAGHWNVAGGFVTPSNYDPFVFTPPPLASWLPSFNLQPFESAGPGIADLDAWTHLSSTLPMLGTDASVSIGHVSAEGTDALLPSPPGTMARMFGFAAALDRGDAGRLSLDWVNVTTTGASLTVPTLYGADPTLHPGAQGNLATSTLARQSQTIAGVRALVHPFAGYDTTLELGRAWFDAGLVARPNSSKPGNYEHLAFARHFNAHDNAGIEFYRFDPRYATAVLPYGIPENVFGVAWIYPGPWLKGTYQLAGNSAIGANRTGVRAFANFNRGRLRANASYYAYRQIEPSSYDNLTQTGFVEVDYLVESPGNTNLGQTHSVATYLGWQLPLDTIGVDFARDTQLRAYNPAAPGDYVDMRYPQIVVSDVHRFSDDLRAEAGYARYSASGTWTLTPVTGIYTMGFAGVQFNFDSSRQQLFVQIRRYGLTGLPSIPGGPPPTLRGTAIVVDHHIAF